MLYLKYLKDFTIITFIFLIFLLLFDNLLFYFPNLFPKKIVNFLSNNAQIRYQLNNPDNLNIEHDKYIFYFKPNKFINELNITIDELGYKNPPGYLNSSNMDILVLGDSYAESKDFIDNLKKFLPYSVYSMGVGGQSILHWKYHYLRFKESDFYKIPPKYVILNYYSGNDISDTQRALKYINAGFINSIYYPTDSYFYEIPMKELKRKYSFFNEIRVLTINILKYYRPRYQIRNLFNKKFMEEKNQSFENNDLFNTIRYNKECNILIGTQAFKENLLFSEETHPEIANQIIDTIKLFDQKKTKIIFNFIPNTITIYADKYGKSSKYIVGHDIQIASSNNFEKFLKKFDVKFINLVSQLKEVANNKPLHPCSGDDLHFSQEGYEIYAKLLAESIIQM